MAMRVTKFNPRVGLKGEKSLLRPGGVGADQFLGSLAYKMSILRQFEGDMLGKLVKMILLGSGHSRSAMADRL